MKTILRSGIRGLVAGILVAALALPTPALASFMDWYNWNFYQGTAHYMNDFYNISTSYGEMREFKTAPYVARSMYEPWSHVCDRQAAIQFYLQQTNYWYAYDYSAYRSGCKLGTDNFSFWVWYRMRLTMPAYTHAWWVDTNTGGNFKLIRGGWIP